MVRERTDHSDRPEKPDRGDKREQIMQAAERLFTGGRLHEVTLEEVAHLAGVGKGTIYLYFKDKDDLFFQTATAGFDEMCDLVRRSDADGLDRGEEAGFAGQLLSACRRITAFVEQRRQLFGMMQVEESRMQFCRGDLHDRWVAQRQKLTAAVADIIRRGVEEGVVRDDVGPEVLAAFLLGMLRTQGRDLPGLLGSPPSHAVVVDLFLHGAAGRGAVGEGAFREAVSRDTRDTRDAAAHERPAAIPA